MSLVTKQEPTCSDYWKSFLDSLAALYGRHSFGLEKNMEYELMRVIDFISAKWAELEAFCEDNGDNPDDIIDVLEKNQ
ncbi:hypothetical protein DLF71_24790 [Escherichia coli O157]|jgi:hypothetical protein|nr:hypothetical protein [Escherichia coli O157]EHK1734117.1 hypothetical protein [Escherichia coli]EHR9622098.1 hypothetical protein [Escherichia coli]EKY5906183.1 hypothetical protein [Escherichia coli]EKY5997373.1 hypothetical protein [Escherichia coli]